MKLQTHCKNCKKDIFIKSNATTRPELQMEKGDEFEVICNNCGEKAQRHVNEIIAKPNRTIILVGVIISVVVTLVLFYFVGAIGTITAIIPAIFWQQQSQASKEFNQYRIRRD